MVSMLCRLCLKKDDLTIDIFEKKFESENLLKQLFDLYQIRVEHNKFSPSRICQMCMFMTQAFNEFRENVKRCDTKLQKNHNNKSKEVTHESKELSSLVIEKSRTEILYNLKPDNDFFVTVVDPNQQCESSDDDFLVESDSEYSINPKSNKIESEVSQSILSNIISEAQKCSIIAPDTLMSVDRIENVNECRNCFHCQYCDMAFTVNVECLKHEARHDAANPFTCNFCPFRVASRQTLIHHIKYSHHNGRPYICSICVKGFCRRSDLKKHTIVHTGVRPYSCSFCRKSFSRNTNLTKHMRIHGDPKSFTASLEQLHQQKMNTASKTFTCSKCGSSFLRKEKFLLHQRTHFEHNIGYFADLKQENANIKDSEKFDTKSSILDTSRSNNRHDSIKVNNHAETDNFRSSFQKLSTTSDNAKVFTNQQDLLRHRPLRQDKLFIHKHPRDKKVHEMQNNITINIASSENLPQFDELLPKITLGFYNETRPETNPTCL